MKKQDKTAIFISKVFKILHIKLKPKTENLLVQIFKFGIVGVIATIIDFGFLALFKEILHFSTVLSNTLSFCISVIFNYIASVKWVFDVNKNKDPKKQFITFIIFSIIGLILSDLIMWALTDKIKLFYILSKVVATIIVMIFNFVTRKIFLE